MYSQYLECREDELNELHNLLDTNHKAVTKWKTDVVEKAKVNSIFYSYFYIFSVFEEVKFLHCEKVENMM